MSLSKESQELKTKESTWSKELLFTTLTSLCLKRKKCALTYEAYCVLILDDHISLWIAPTAAMRAIRLTLHSSECIFLCIPSWELSLCSKVGIITVETGSNIPHASETCMHVPSHPIFHFSLQSHLLNGREKEGCNCLASRCSEKAPNSMETAAWSTVRL